MSVERKIKITSIVFTTVFVMLSVILIGEFIYIGNLNSTKSGLEGSLNSLQNDINSYSTQNTYLLDRETYLRDYAHETLSDQALADEIWFIGK